LKCNEVDDWFLPSKDELDLAYNRLAQNRVGGQDTPVGGFNKGYYWTSTDYNNATAWTQYFMDGQQFDRVQTLSGNNKPPANPFRVRPIRAFGTNNVVLSCAQGGTCKLGDIGPGGGTVFYVAPDLLMVNGKGARYLEVSPPEAKKRMNWSCEKGFADLKTSVRIGSGAFNTSLMKKACPGFYDEVLNVGGAKTDWFIPSRDELFSLGEYFKGFEKGLELDISESFTWSSSSSSAEVAYLVIIWRNFPAQNGKQSNRFIRPVRAFG